MNYYFDAVTVNLPGLLETVTWIRDEEKYLFAFAGLNTRLDEIANSIEMGSASIVGQLKMMEALCGNTVAQADNGIWNNVKGIFEAFVLLYDFKKVWTGKEKLEGVWPWLIKLMGGFEGATSGSTLLSALLPALGVTGVIIGGVSLFSNFMEKVTGNEPTPVPSIRANPKPEPTYKESFQEMFTPKIRHISDWETSLTRQMNTFIQYSSDVDNRQNFVDSSTSLGQQTAMVQQQTGGDTIYQITMNNSFAVDREETADYCIGELCRRMRAELDGARLGVAY